MLDRTLEVEGLGPSAFSRALDADWQGHRFDIASELAGASILVVGAAGAIGAAAVRQLLELEPARLELVDIDENGLARLARDIRSRDAGAGVRIGFNTLDFAGPPGLAFAASAAPFDLVLDFAAVKHVRSEKNLFTLLHMIDVNIVRQQRFAEALKGPPRLARRHFVVSTDKAADPANFMGASKRMLEAITLGQSDPGAPAASMARFANVAWSSGSLLESYLQRYAAGQALAAPRDTRRFFISAREAVRICLIAQLVCSDGRIVVPKFDPADGAVELADTAAAFLLRQGRRPVFVETPEAAAALEGRAGPDYPVLLTARDTAGEKEVEVFCGKGEAIEPLNLAALAAVRPAAPDASALATAVETLRAFVEGRRAARVDEIEAVMRSVMPNFRRAAADASLDDRI